MRECAGSCWLIKRGGNILFFSIASLCGGKLCFNSSKRLLLLLIGGFLFMGVDFLSLIIFPLITFFLIGDSFTVGFLANSLAVFIKILMGSCFFSEGKAVVFVLNFWLGFMRIRNDLYYRILSK